MLRASNLSRRFGDRVAVDGVSLEISAGEVFGLLGPNGAGKTTTLRMLGGLILPSSGSITIDGTPLDRRNVDALRRRIGFLTETPGLWEALTVSDNITTYARLFGVAGAATAAESLLRRFELWDRRDDRASTISKGMKQKLALARALVHDPEIVLLDEPTANLDPHTAREVRELIDELRDRGRAVIISTHNLDEVDRVASRIALISTRLIAVGEPATLRREVFGRVLRISLASPPPPGVESLLALQGATDIRCDADSLRLRITEGADHIPAIVSALVHAGARISEVREERQSLEEVYMRLLESGREVA